MTGTADHKFTVVIPSYNLGKTLERSVNSVLNQTLEFVEVIIVDDASVDKHTLEVLKRIEKNNIISVFYFSHNRGVAAARNYGIKKAKSRYILCLDSDDYIEPTYLEKAYNIFESNAGIGIIAPWYKTFGDNEGVWKYSSDFNLIDLFAENRLPSGSCVRKCVYEEVGYYDENRSLSGMDDWDLWIRVFSQTAWRPHVINEPLFNYFIRMDSQQHSADSTKVKGAISAIFQKNSFFIQRQSNILCVEMQNKIHNLRIQNKKCIHDKRRLSDDVEHLEKKLESLKNTKVYQLSDLFFRTIKSPFKMTTFPINVLRILLKK